MSSMSQAFLGLEGTYCPTTERLKSLTAVKHVMFLMCCVNVISRFVNEIEVLVCVCLFLLFVSRGHKKQQLLSSEDIISSQAEPSCLWSTHLSTPRSTVPHTNPSEETCICLWDADPTLVNPGNKQAWPKPRAARYGIGPQHSSHTCCGILIPLANGFWGVPTLQQGLVCGLDNL